MNGFDNSIGNRQTDGLKKIKILQINKLYYPTTGGIERVVQQIAEGLNESTDMKVLVCREKGTGFVENINGVEVHRAGSLGVLFSLPISFSFFRQMRKLAKDRDVLHFHMPFPLGDLACLLSGYRGKVVVWWHSDIVRQKKLMKLYRPLMEWFLKRADVIVVATKGHIEGSDYLAPYAHKCKIIPYGVDEAIAQQASWWIESRGSADEMPVSSKSVRTQELVRFLFVGRLVYYKGCKILLEAFSKVHGAELIIVGSGTLEAELKQMVNANGLKDYVTFSGNIPDEELTEEFKHCDVFVLPSIVKSEAFGLVQMEAMAYGKPVINTKLPSGVPYVSLDGVTGLTVMPGDVRELAAAMQWMVDHEKERLDMGRAARERAQKDFKMETMLEKVLKVYEGNL